MTRIICNPNVMLGKPVIEGTRITVELILEKLAAGETIEEITGSYPVLTKDSILAAIDFARESLKTDRIYSIIEGAA